MFFLKKILFVLALYLAGCSELPVFIFINASNAPILIETGTIKESLAPNGELKYRYKGASMGTISIKQETCRYSYEISDLLLKNDLLYPKEEEITFSYKGNGELILIKDDLHEAAAEKCRLSNLCEIPVSEKKCGQ